jgi:hypothetical protein
MSQFTEIKTEKTGRLSRDLFRGDNAPSAVCLLASTWNRLTSPSALRTDEEFAIASRLARAVKGRLLRYVGSTSEVRLVESDSGAYWVRPN